MGQESVVFRDIITTYYISKYFPQNM